MIRFDVLGEPVAKGRPKFARRGAMTIAYTPEKTVNYEELVRWSYKNRCGHIEPLEGPLVMTINAIFKIPKSASKANAEKMQLGLIMPTKKPDATNVAKSVEDALNGIAYKDDSQIVSMYIHKRYGLEPRVEVSISRAE